MYREINITNSRQEMDSMILETIKRAGAILEDGICNGKSVDTYYDHVAYIVSREMDEIAAVETNRF